MVAPFEKFDLTGKTALVTGGATGLGYHMARALARAGAKVLIAARRKDVLQQATESLMADPYIKHVSWHPVDLADRESVAALIAYAGNDFGGIDILVGNAGATYAEQIADIKPETVDEIYQLNLTSNIQLAQAFLPRMQERKWGRLIFSSSIGSVMALPLQGTVVYSTTKAAVSSLARGLAGDLGHHNITANSLILGFFMTDILTDVARQIREAQGAAAATAFLNEFASNTALGRIGDPAEIEGLLQLLASDAGSYITGANIAIDGGMSIMMRPLAVT